MKFSVLATFLFSLLVTKTLARLNSSASVEDFLVSSWKSLGWNGILALGFVRAYPNLVSRASQANISCRFLLNKNDLTVLKRENILFKQNPPQIEYLTLMDLSEKSLKLFLEVLQSNTWPAFRIMVVLWPQQSDSWASAKASLKQFNISRGFYAVNMREADAFELLSVQTLMHEEKTLDDVIMTSSNVGNIQQIYDLKGILITTSTKPYLPFLGIIHCDDQEMNCETFGLMSDIFEGLASMFNFTLRVDLIDKWGSVPETGSYEYGNATFTGAFGAVVYEECQISLSSWTPLIERSTYVDFPMGMVATKRDTYVNGRQAAIDVDLFLRPFTKESWMCTFLRILFIWTVMTAVKKIMDKEFGISKNDSSDSAYISHRILIFSSWLLFVLLESYYGGALTMFFSSSPSPPFLDLKEAMNLYPEWKLIVPKINEIAIHTRAQAGQKAFQQFLERAEKPGSEEFQPTPKATLEKLKGKTRDGRRVNFFEAFNHNQKYF